MHKSRFVTGATLLVLITLGLQSPGQDRAIKMVVTPAGEPAAVLYHQLLPKFLDQTPGNAADEYKIAFEKMPSNYRGDFSEELSRLLRLPLDELRVSEAEALIQPFRGAIQAAKKAAWCYQCDGGHLVRQPESVLPPLKDYPFHWLNKPLWFETKLQIKEGKYDSALENMEFRFAMARHITYFNDTSAVSS